ncbi:MerR family transcriptional regulator [Nocardia sp. PE-7]|uniref:DNA polymerase III subunit beta family protein n=1 Tax=Nocardia sp. PE-7 TaxID=3058426 RepID=UPI00265AFBC5|nr:MerR family transcriptional regulator [Nocardia sp. PE-7]WKG07094.1 MerR family transcriptional regulator [Nocardia sp. PE-7]
MPDTDLITIGAFARACGLSTSALRFYADAGVLAPVVVDEVTGYRYYAPEQSAPARLLRHLRAIDMPLPAVTALLAEPDPARALVLLDEHLADLDRHQSEVRTAAAAALGALLAIHGSASGGGGGHRDQVSVPTDDRGGARSPLGTAQGPEKGSTWTRDDVWVSGPVLAAAIDQVATATVADPDLAVLDTILFETDGQQLILTATDRYRLATRTVRPTRFGPAVWDATVHADDLRAAASWLRRRHAVAIRPHRDHVEFRMATADSVDRDRTEGAGELMTHHAAQSDDTRRCCRRSTHDFPDYRAMLAALAPVRTRVVLTRAALLDAMEHLDSPAVVLHTTSTGAVSVTTANSWTEPAAPTDTATTGDFVAHTSSGSAAATERVWHIPHARATGPAMTIHFAVTTLYPAVATAVGPDVMLDLIAPDQPVLIRSADDGDLSTLAMPRKPEPTEEISR